jgi:hypothetical protein
LALAACQGVTPTSSGQQPAASTSSPATPVAQATTASGMETTPVGPSAPPSCTVVSFAPTPGPTEQSLFPPVNDKDWVQGPPTATVTIIEYSDFM